MLLSGISTEVWHTMAIKSGPLDYTYNLQYAVIQMHNPSSLFSF